jgi:hypothetical protein
LQAELNCSDDSDDDGCHQVGGQVTFSVNDHIIIKVILKIGSSVILEPDAEYDFKFAHISLLLD